MFEIDRVSKVFGQNTAAPTVALSEFSLTIGEGEFVCFLGPSGCGKTTLLQMLAGLEEPTGGEIRFKGQPVSEPDPDRCYVFQRFALFPWLTALENVAFGLRFKGVPAAERQRIAREKLQMVGLAGFAHHYPFELSGGMQQRVAIARALAIAPRSILMDEPFGALDAQTRHLMQKELVRLWQESGERRSTVVFVTHDITESLLLGDRIVLFTSRPGRIKAEFQVDLPRPRDPFDPRFVELSREILSLLEEEIALAMGAELGTSLLA